MIKAKPAMIQEKSIIFVKASNKLVDRLNRLVESDPRGLTRNAFVVEMLLKHITQLESEKKGDTK